MKKLLGFLGIVFLFGCASGSHIVTGDIHNPIPAQSVKLYSTPPEKFEIIGSIQGNSPGRNQAATDRAIAQLKKQAGSLGANGVLMGASAHSSTPVMVGTVMVNGDETSVSGQAIFVP
jgi:hypothetical protein